MHGNQLIAIQKGGSADAADGHLITPDRLTGADVEADHIAARGAGVEQAFAISPLEDGVRVGGVLGRSAGGGSPDMIATVLVEGEEAIAGRSLRPPVGCHGVNDDKVIINEGADGSPVGIGETPEFLDEWLLPDQIAVRGETVQQTRGRHAEDVPALGIDAGAGDGITVVNDIREKIAEASFPDYLARLLIETEKNLLKIGTIALVGHEVHATIGHDRSAASVHRKRPAGVGRFDGIREISLQGDSALHWAAPAQPSVDLLLLGGTCQCCALRSSLLAFWIVVMRSLVTLIRAWGFVVGSLAFIMCSLVVRGELVLGLLTRLLRFFTAGDYREQDCQQSGTENDLSVHVSLQFSL